MMGHPMVVYHVITVHPSTPKGYIMMKVNPHEPLNYMTLIENWIKMA